MGRIPPPSEIVTEGADLWPLGPPVQIRGGHLKPLADSRAHMVLWQPVILMTSADGCMIKYNTRESHKTLSRMCEGKLWSHGTRIRITVISKHLLGDSWPIIVTPRPHSRGWELIDTMLLLLEIFHSNTGIQGHNWMSQFKSFCANYLKD